MRNSKHSLIIRTLFSIALAMSGGCSNSGNSEGPPGNGNTAPFISGSPVTSIVFGQNYSFTPNASDPNGDDLTFTISNAPAWSGFNTVTGELSGSPIVDDIGQYADIVISVSDGNLSTSLQGFSIDVVDVGNFSVSLSWIPPTQNSDDSSLTDLAGYNIYHGLEEGHYSNVIRIDNPGIAEYVVDGLTANTHYFVATAINSSGMESDFSNATIHIPE